MAEALFPTRWKHDKPPSLERFMADFPDDYACAEHLAERRWPDGFVCPHCGSKKGWRLEAKPWVWECAGKGDAPRCRKQTSVISGTVMHGTHLPLRTWFIAAYLVATHSNGISALQLQPKIGVGSYKTAWLLLHKLRRAMVAPDRAPLEGDVEIDETSIPFRRAEESPTGGQGKSTVGKIFIIGAVEKRGGRSAGRIRLQRIPEDTGRHIRPFVETNTAPGCAIYTDANSSYLGIPSRTHIPRNLSARNELPAHITFERIHRVFSNLKRWGLGTYHGLRDKHADAYLNEFVFRWNRRRLFRYAIDRMLGIGQSCRRFPTATSSATPRSGRRSAPTRSWPWWRRRGARRPEPSLQPRGSRSSRRWRRCRGRRMAGPTRGGNPPARCYARGGKAKSGSRGDIGIRLWPEQDRKPPFGDTATGAPLPARASVHMHLGMRSEFFAEGLAERARIRNGHHPGPLPCPDSATYPH